MMRRTEGGLPISQLAQLARKTLDNAVELIEEAEIMALHERFARALALAVLAAEEFGKHMMCFGAITQEPDDKQYWRRFWERFYKHPAKYLNVANMLPLAKHAPETLEEFVELVDSHIDPTMSSKLAGLYVDIDGERVVSPQEAINKDEALAAVRVIRTVVKAGAALYGGRNFEEVFDMAVELHKKGDLTRAAESMAREDINILAEMIQKLFEDKSAER